jgi:hypothetical protein
MSERKYRQRGYQDDDRERRPQKPPSPPPSPRDRIGPRTYNMPGYREVVRCARCGQTLSGDIGPATACARCGTALRSCVQCVHFDTGRTFECAQTIPARITPKDGRNDCPLFEPQRRVERQTGETGPASGSSARQAFDDLFK